ncbi:MAG: PAS domain-containing protein [Bacteroidales bacterium]|nr:PAS domain-containing protein [Bacteroidales bacterium]
MDPVLVSLTVLAAISYYACIQEIVLYFVKKYDRFTFLRGAILSFIIGTYLVISMVTHHQGVTSVHSYTLYRINLIFLQLSLVALILIMYFLSDRKHYLFIYSGLIIMGIMIFISAVIPVSFLFGQVFSGIKLLPVRDNMILPLQQYILRWHLLQYLTIGIFIVLVLTILVAKAISARKWIHMAMYFSVGFIILTTGLDILRILGDMKMISLIPYAVFFYLAILTIFIYNVLIGDILLKYKDYEDENKCKYLLNNANFIVVKLNRLGHVEYINPYFCKLTGFQENEVAGKDWFEFFIPSQSLQELQGTFIEILESDFHARYQNPIVTKSGEEIMVNWYNSRITDKDGKIAGSFSIGGEVYPSETPIEKLSF